MEQERGANDSAPGRPEQAPEIDFEFLILLMEERLLSLGGGGF